MKKRLTAILLSAIMIIGMLPAVALAADYADTSGHWAEGAINRWSGYGVVNGKTGSTFDPEAEMTRAEAAQVFANLLGLNKEADLSAYADAQDDWFTSAIAKCVAAGILNGKGDGVMDPNGLITREEFLTMYARAVCISNGADPAEAKTGLEQKGFADTAQVSDWAADAIGTLVDKGYVNGMTETNIAPQANINRASVMALLDQSISTYVGKDSTETTVAAKSEGITLIANPAVTTVTGTADVVVVAAGSEKYDRETGEFEHNDIRVESAKMPVARVQGENITVTLALSTTAEDATVTETGVDSIIVIESTSEAKNASVEAEGAKIIVKDGAKAESVTVAETAKSATVETAKNATVGTVTIAAESATATVAGKVETVKVEETAKNATIDTKSTAKVETVENKAENTAVTGTGSVGAVKSSEDVKVETKNTKVENTSETKEIAVTDNKGKETKVDSGTTGQTTPSAPTGGGGGGGHSHSYTGYVAISSTQHKGTCSCGETTTADHTMVEDICSVCGYKADSVAVIYGTPDQYFATLANAVEAAQAGETVTLLADAELTGDITISEKVTLDLNGKTIETAAYKFAINGAAVTVTGNGKVTKQTENTHVTEPEEGYLPNPVFEVKQKGSLTVENGIFESKSFAAFNINDATFTMEDGLIKCTNAKKYDTKCLVKGTNGATMNILGGTIESYEGCGDYFGMYGVWTEVNSTLNLGKEGTNGPTIHSYYAPITMNGSTSPAFINVFSGTFIADCDCADAEEDMNVMQIAADNANGTKVNIYGGTFTQTAATNKTSHVIEIRWASEKTINIYGGTFCSNSSVIHKNNVREEANTNLSITGGIYSSNPAEYVAPGYAASKNSDNTYNVKYLFAYKPDGTASAGTEEDPFLIATSTQFMGINNVCLSKTGSYCFKLTEDIDISTKYSGYKAGDLYLCVVYFYNCSFNGGGHTITCKSTVPFYDGSGSTFENLTVNGDDSKKAFCIKLKTVC